MELTTHNNIRAELDRVIGDDDFSKFPHGGSCWFFPIGSKWAAKLYRTYVEAFSCWSWQKQCWRIAPRVLGKVFTYQLDNRTWYGYITEVVTTIEHVKFTNITEEALVLSPICDELERKLNKLGLTNHDWSKQNLGINSKNKYILIDFSHVNEMEERSLYM